MRTFLFSMVIGIAGMGAGCSKDKATSGEAAHDDLATMSLDDVEKGIAANELTAVDCNGDGTRKKLGTLPGSVLISDEEAFPSSELPADKTRKLVFYCTGPT